MKSRGYLDWLMGVTLALLAFCFFGMFMSCRVAMERANELQNAGCTLSSEKETGRSIYCGKACYRKEKEYSYACTVEPKSRVVIR